MAGQVAWAHPKFANILASCSYYRRVIIWQVKIIQLLHVPKKSGPLVFGQVKVEILGLEDTKGLFQFSSI